MTTAVTVRSNLHNKTTAANLAKSFEHAFLTDGSVEIFPGFRLGMEDAATLVRMCFDDADRAGGTLKENMAHYVREALIDRLIDYRNGDCGQGKLWMALQGH